MLTWRISFATLESHPEQKGNPLRVRNLRRWYYVSKRMDLFFEQVNVDEKITDLPSTYLERIYYDSIIYQADGLQSLINLAGPDRVMFGTDYPLVADIPVLKQLVEGLPSDQTAKVLGRAAENIFAI